MRLVEVGDLLVLVVVDLDGIALVELLVACYLDDNFEELAGNCQAGSVLVAHVDKHLAELVLDAPAGSYLGQLDNQLDLEELVDNFQVELVLEASVDNLQVELVHDRAEALLHTAEFRLTATK